MQWKLTMTLLCGVASSACVSVGYGMGYATATADYAGDDSILDYTKQVDYSRAYHQFRLVDRSGLLLAGLVNAGRQAEARNQAMDQAAARGAKAGDKVEYSYDPFDILPGPRVTADLRLGLGPATTTFTGAGGVVYEAGDYWAFDVGADPAYWSFLDDTLMASVGAWMLLENWSLSDQDAPNGFEHDQVSLDVYMTGKLGYRVPQLNLGITGKMHVGIVSPLLAALVGGDQSPSWAWSSGLEAAWNPLTFLTVQADLVYARPVWLETPLRGGHITRIGLNVIVDIETLTAFAKG